MSEQEQLSLEAPGGGGDGCVRLFLEDIRQVAEKVDASQFFQTVDADDVGFQVFLVFVERAVFKIEANGFVASVRGALVLAEDGHEEVFGYEQPRAGRLDDIRAMVDGAAFDDVEGVAEGVVVPRSNLLLELQPNAAIEIIELGLHIGVEEGLLIQSSWSLLPILRCNHVPAGVTGTTIKLFSVSTVEDWDVEILTPSFRSPYIIIVIASIPAECSPSLCFFNDVPFDTEVNSITHNSFDEEHIDDTTLEVRNFQSSRHLALIRGVGVDVDGGGIHVVIIRRAAPQTQRGGCDEQE